MTLNKLKTYIVGSVTGSLDVFDPYEITYLYIRSVMKYFNANIQKVLVHQQTFKKDS